MCDKHNIDVGFSQERFPAGTHMCLIYSNEDERRDVIAKYLKAGLDNNEKVGYFADMMSTPEIARWLAGYGIEIPPDPESNLKTSKESTQNNNANFVCTNALDTYCPSGKFVPETMLNNLRTAYEQAREQQFPGIRVSGEMSWALKGVPGAERIMEYEALVNDVLATHPVTAICQYDANRFDGGTILDVLKVHPMMIVHGQIVKNPYYMKSQDFLADYHQR
ncbi:MEDS domain-containing protein [Pseudomonadota bacterium]